MEYSAFKQAVIRRAQALGLTEYELYYEEGRDVQISIFEHQVDKFSASTEGGVCFRCIVNGKMGYAATESLSEADAIAIVDRAADNARILEAEEEVFLAQGGQQYAQIPQAEDLLPETDTLLQAAISTQESLYALGAVDGTTTSQISQISRVAICNSLGLDLDHRSAINACVIGAVVAEGEEKSNDYQFAIAAQGLPDTQAAAQKAVSAARNKLGGEPAPTGVYPVVFDPEAMSDLLNVYSSIFSSEAVQKGLSRLKDKEGTQIAAPGVSILDDPFHPANPMHAPFDGEGSPTATRYVVQEGKLCTLLYNLKTAKVAGKATTGNAAKGGYDTPVGIRPFTMYLAGGSYTEAQLLQQAGNGVYIHTLSGLHAGANPITGDFSLQSAGYLIENGVKTSPVKAFTVAGNFYDLLMHITALADNVTIPAPTGKTTFGAPSVLVEGLSIAGK